MGFVVYSILAGLCIQLGVGLGADAVTMGVFGADAVLHGVSERVIERHGDGYHAVERALMMVGVGSVMAAAALFMGGRFIVDTAVEWKSRKEGVDASR